MEGPLMSWKPTSCFLPCGRSARGELGLLCNPKNRDTMIATEKNSVVAAMKPVSEDPEGKDGEKSQLSLELSLSTDHEITSSAFSSKSNEKKPVLFDFLSTWENDDQVGEAEELATKNQHGLDLGEISLDLKLGCASSCITKKRKKASENSAIAKLPASSSRACGIKRMKPNSQEVKKEEKPAAFDPWVIKKRIQKSDIGDLSRLLLAADGVKKHILPMWDAKQIEKIKDGVHVAVWDCDTKSEKQLKFKKWRSGRSYVLIEKWTKEFVKRRGLMKGDEVGLYWDQSNSRFNFSILQRALIDY